MVLVLGADAPAIGEVRQSRTEQVLRSRLLQEDAPVPALALQTLDAWKRSSDLHRKSCRGPLSSGLLSAEGRPREKIVNVAHVLCPVDFSEASKQAIQQATVVGRYYRSRVTALHVLTPLALGVVTAEEERDSVDRVRQALVAECDATAEATDLEVLVDVGDPVVTILGRAASLPADLIVIGTHGTSGFQHLILGSVTEKVLRRATCRVLTVPPRTHATSRLPFRRILCPVDFSDASRTAARSAASLAQESGAALTLLTVLEWPWPEPPPPPMHELAAEQREALAEFRRYTHESAKKRLESLVFDMQTPAAVTRVGDGKPYIEILRVAAEEQADLIVMGVHGRNPVDMALFGSTTNQVVRRATCPVLTTRQ